MTCKPRSRADAGCDLPRSSRDSPLPWRPGNELSRPIRSYVLRRGRTTDAQKRAISEDWGDFVVTPQTPFPDIQAFFPSPAPLVAEIGFGDGASLIEQINRFPENNYLGIEVYTPGIGGLIHAAKRLQLERLKICHGDALDILEACIPAGSIDQLQLYFPDPWLKRRHHKRRLLRADTIPVFSRALKPGGLLHIATDWQPYAKEIMELIDAEQPLTRIDAPDIWRPTTKFERRGLALRHKVFDILARRSDF